MRRRRRKKTEYITEKSGLDEKLREKESGRILCAERTIDVFVNCICIGFAETFLKMEKKT